MRLKPSAPFLAMLAGITAAGIGGFVVSAPTAHANEATEFCARVKAQGKAVEEKPLADPRVKPAAARTLIKWNRDLLEVVPAEGHTALSVTIAYYKKLATIRTLKRRVTYANEQADIIAPAQRVFSALVQKYCIHFPDAGAATTSTTTLSS